jgi:phosphoglycerate dehydrogenase-like enzyme
MTIGTAPALGSALVAGLLRAEAYPHPVIEPIRLAETHISWVLLTGQYAYKLKKPLRLSFLDYSTLERRHGTLRGRAVGILGMAFKAESDDTRASLSYKLRKLLSWAGARVLCTDPYVQDERLVPLEAVLAEADTIVIGAPHRAYRDLDLGDRDVVDVWNALGRGIVL